MIRVRASCCSQSVWLPPTRGRWRTQVQNIDRSPKRRLARLSKKQPTMGFTRLTPIRQATARRGAPAELGDLES